MRDGDILSIGVVCVLFAIRNLRTNIAGIHCQEAPETLLAWENTWKANVRYVVTIACQREAHHGEMKRKHTGTTRAAWARHTNGYQGKKDR